MHSDDLEALKQIMRGVHELERRWKDDPSTFARFAEGTPVMFKLENGFGILLASLNPDEFQEEVDRQRAETFEGMADVDWDAELKDFIPPAGFLPLDVDPQE